MSDLFSGFAQELSEKARNANPEPEKQYMGEDGFFHCSICHEPVQMKAPEECRNIFPSGINPIAYIIYQKGVAVND